MQKRRKLIGLLLCCAAWGVGTARALPAGGAEGIPSVQQSSGYAGSTPSITLRGGTSYDGSGEPLVVVDGQVRTDGLAT